MTFDIVLTIAVLGLFAAAVLWGEDSRIGFIDPRRRESDLGNRRSEVR